MNVFIALAATATVAFAAGSWSESRRQAIAAEGQLEEAKKQTGIAEQNSRPFLVPTVANDHLAISPPYGNERKRMLGGVDAEVIFTNYGTTPAAIHKIEGEITINLPRDTYTVPELHDFGFILPVGKSYSQRPYTRPISDFEVKAIAKYGESVYLHGKIFYTGVAGGDYHTFYCYRQYNSWFEPPHGLVSASGPNCTNEVK